MNYSRIQREKRTNFSWRVEYRSDAAGDHRNRGGALPWRLEEENKQKMRIHLEHLK